MILERNLTACTRLICVSEPDGRGGFCDTWSETETLDACFVSTQSPHGHANKTVSVRANKDDAVAEYTMFTRREISLPFHAVIRREIDKKCFRILSDAADTCTPSGARLNLRMYAAEEFRVPVS